MRPARLIEGFGPGGTPDIVARLIGRWLTEHLGQPLVIENRTGASGNIAAEAVARAPPDGYTLLMATTAAATGATFYDKLNFNFIRDFAPVAAIIRVPYVIDLNLSVPARTVPELITYAKANPGRINMASAGSGSGTHLSGELFKMMAGVDMLHVPYRGAPFADLIAGQVQVYFGPVAASLELIRGGRIRPLAVTTAQRSQALPDIPAVAEFVPDYETSFWCGVMAPKNTAVEVIETLNQEINGALADPSIETRIAGLGGSAIAGSAAEFGKLIANETDKWAKVIRAANIKAE